jgi:F-box domain./Leucine Rich Repeat.
MADSAILPSSRLGSGVSEGMPPDNEVVGPLPETDTKKKGRERLLQGLQRISSSPSLARLSRPRSASSPYSMGSLSYASLSSVPSPLGQPSASSYYSQTSCANPSSVPTSIPGSPTTEEPPEYICVNDSHLSSKVKLAGKLKAKEINLWKDLPHELKIHVLSFLPQKELVRISRVSKEFHNMCFDGQLWARLDASEFYQKIPAEALAKIVLSAGSFVRDLNLRGCVQVEHYKKAEKLAQACNNLQRATLEGCRNFQRPTLHSLIRANPRLVHLNLTGLPAVTNVTCKVIAKSCPQLEYLDVSWCKQMDSTGVRFIINDCPNLKDLRVREIEGFNDPIVAEAIFRTNNLERLILAGCEDLTDSALQIMLRGQHPEIDVLTGLPVVPPRKLRHLDLSCCNRLTNNGVKALAHLVPNLEGLQLSGVTRLTDAALEPILATTPRLTHLELEDIQGLTNALFSQHLVKAPCAPVLEHLSVSGCERLGDSGLLPLFRICTNLRSVYMDNTRISDLVLAEAAAMVTARSARILQSRPQPTSNDSSSHILPVVGLRLEVYDCPLITWTGVREIMSRNTEVPRLPKKQTTKDDSNTNSDATNCSAEQPTVQPCNHSYPAEIISLKCFYGWQMTVDEHTKRVLDGKLMAARRLERLWANYMQANEEAGIDGSGARRRRRRVRAAQQVHDQDAGDGGNGAGGVGNETGDGGPRRRARTTACIVM